MISIFARKPPEQKEGAGQKGSDRMEQAVPSASSDYERFLVETGSRRFHDVEAMIDTEDQKSQQPVRERGR